MTHVEERLEPERTGISRRNVLRAGAVGAALVGAGAAKVVMQPSLQARGLLSRDGLFDGASIALADSLYDEDFPISPLILNPFRDPLPIPSAARPLSPTQVAALSPPPGPGIGQQNSFGNETHQIWPNAIGFPDPIVYKFDLLVRQHSFTSSQVLPINSLGQTVTSFDAAGNTYPAGTVRTLPPSTIYGFNGTFPGPMVNAEYGRPVLIRFENHLDENPLNLDRQDFGTEDFSFLTHLHNAHTAPESDGNPHYSMLFGPKAEGYPVKSFVDNLYLNWPAGNDDREKQSFFWFHDHRMDHTGSNVYKGMVGLYPIYDPKNNLDAGDETQGLRLPGVRTDHADGSFDVDYDIPLAIYDVRLDDGVTDHLDIHDTLGEFPEARNPREHPEWWGKTFFKHFPNHGFVGDIFTVNGTAFPTLEVKRRKYRFRFLDASIARIYEFTLMTSTTGPVPARDLGYATDGGSAGAVADRGRPAVHALDPGRRRRRPAAVRDHPGLVRAVAGEAARAHRRLHQVPGRLAHQEGRRHLPDQRHADAGRPHVVQLVAVPARSQVQDPGHEDRDRRRRAGQLGDAEPDHETAGPPAAAVELEDPPRRPADLRGPARLRRRRAGMAHQRQAVRSHHRAGQPEEQARAQLQGDAEEELLQPLGDPQRRRRLGAPLPSPHGRAPHGHAEQQGRHRDRGPRAPGDDISREDLVALDPSESTIIYRGFRDFVGPYVAHCHNLAHEDHAMMFGWTIVP